ncbi:MAG: HTTM domain-containing protein [Myxococcales bacterium]|nr:HTTM domain-containing protein [Myxococcales bacterium]
MRELLALLSRWFFVRGDPRTAAALRIAYCGVYLCMLWDFYPVMGLLFGDGGLFGTLEPFPYDISEWQFFLFHHDSRPELAAWFWGSVALALAGALGLCTRLSVLLTYLSVIVFQERGPFMIFGADLVMRCVGLWIVLVDGGRVWSIDAALRRRRGAPPPGEIELWPVRAIQIQVVLVYLITGLLKLRAPPWQEGSAVYYALQVGNMLKGQSHAWLLSQRGLLAALDYGVLVIELALPLCLLYRPLRRWGVLMGVAMHTGIDLLMSIRFFSLTMYMGYLAFLDDDDWRRLRSDESWIGRLRARLRGQRAGVDSSRT